MKILVIGGGGREHALAWKLTQSLLVQKVFVAPGNAGTAREDGLQNVMLAGNQQVIDFINKNDIALTVVGPEAPLAAGVVDAVRGAGQRIFGPTQKAAQLESSKDFAKNFMVRHHIPTAKHATFSDAAAAHAYIDREGAPIVIKADGLAAGKGVVVAMRVEEAHAAVDMMLVGNKMGSAGARVVIEEFLDGEEASFIVLADGRNALALASSQDHKRLQDGDQGPNTGGMGAYSPAPVLTPVMEERVMAEIVRPTLAGMAQRGTPFKGVLFAGLMITTDGPKLIEYNVRFGDPECEVLMPRLRSDIAPALVAACDGVLDQITLRWSEQAALTVVLAAKGYPAQPETGSVIKGVEKAAAMADVLVFHAGTRRTALDLVASGGRVLNVVGLGNSVGEAQRKAYAAVDAIDWPGGFCRRDIGWQAVQREQG